MSGNDVQRRVRCARIIRAVFITAAVLLAVVACKLVTRDLADGIAMAFPAAILLTLAVLETSNIWQWRAEAQGTVPAASVRESVLRRVTRRPRRIMTPDDYRHLRELETELGWEPSEPLMPVPEPVRPARMTAARPAVECIRCGQGYEAHGDGMCVPCRRQERRVMTAMGRMSATPLSGTGTLSAKATWDDVAYPSEASQHFAQLARVGRERCIGSCPMCEGRDRQRAADESMRQWIEEGRWEQR